LSDWQVKRKGGKKAVRKRSNPIRSGQDQRQEWGGGHERVGGRGQRGRGKVYVKVEGQADRKKWRVEEGCE